MPISKIYPKINLPQKLYPSVRPSSSMAEENKVFKQSNILRLKTLIYSTQNKMIPYCLQINPKELNSLSFSTLQSEILQYRYPHYK